MATYNQLKTEMDELNGSLIKLRYAINDIESNLKYHIPLTSFFKAARSQLDATLYCYNELVSMFESATDLSDFQKKYVETQLTGFSQTIDAFGLRIKPTEIDESILENGEYEGVVTSVDDGDTVWIDDNIEVRIPGIDAPEKGTDNGQLKKTEMEKYVLGKRVKVMIDPHTPLDLYQRVLGTLFTTDGSLAEFNGNVTKALASTCNCVQSTQYGKNMYVDPEEIKALMSRCKASLPGMGRVKIYGSPAKMAMYLDGVNTNMVTPKPLDLPFGRHVIELRADNRATKALEIDVGIGEQSYTLNLPTLPQTTGLVDIESSIPGDVTIDSVLYGATPMVVELSLADAHEITIDRPGYAIFTKTVTLDDQKMTIVSPDQEMEQGNEPEQSTVE